MASNEAVPATSKQELDLPGASSGVGLLDFDELAKDVEVTTVPIQAADGVFSRGVFYARGGERTVVIMSHPRSDFSRHYAVPALLEAGYAFWGHQCRGINNDVDCEHERLLLDLAAGVRYLKEQLGFERVVLLGNSGGGSLLAFYQQQASTAPPGRLTDTAAGEPCDLNAIDMPAADGLAFIAVHGGEGQFMLDGIDPSVVDEDDPLAVDPELDMYNPANGFRPLPEESSYSEQFVEKYRAAQLARVARIDARARAYLADQHRHRALMAEPGFSDLPLAEQIHINRRAVVGQYLITHRTEANLAYLDLSLHSWRSTRRARSLIGSRPDEINFAPGGFGRYLTPRAWLSSWSALSTRADLANSLKSVHEPVLVISYTSDNGCFPDQNEAQLAGCPASDKTHEFVAIEHFGYPLAGRSTALDVIVSWLKARFPDSPGR